MNETEKVAIETELALREKFLEFKKKKQDLNRETWRRVSVFIATGFILLLCACVAAFGGWGIYSVLNNENMSKRAKSCENTHLNFTPINLDGGGKETKAILNNAPAVVMANDKKAFIMQPESKPCPHSWMPNIALIINGLLVLSGLGGAAFLGNRLYRELE